MPTIPAPTSRLVLRDGSTAGVRPATVSDRDAMHRFFDELSPVSRRLRFLGATTASEALLDRFCDNGEPQKTLTLIVCRQGQENMHIIGVGSYFAESETSAEVAFAVDDRFHGRGIATALLERLAVYGKDQNFEYFSASVLPENAEMLDVFRDSGFEVHSTPEAGVVEVRLSLQSSPASIAAADEREHQATIASLRSIVKPRAVAVLGASRRESNLGRRVLEALTRSGFKGLIYPVNPATADLGGVRCYPSARDLPPGVDLAVIAVPRESVLTAIDDCAAAGINGVVVISAGFAETDERGRDLQTELVERVRGYGMRMVGPNCMGVINTDPAIGLNASFAEHLPPPGRIALASQSGGLGLAVLNLAASRQIGLSTFVSLGNKADISGNDILQYAEHDAGTSVVLLYLESFGNPRRFGQIARRVSRTKPIVVVKSGRTVAGLRAAASHTAGLAASELAVDGLFQQAGVIRADTIDEMFDLAVCLDLQPLPPGRRVAIVTNAGGPGILAADACVAGGLDVQPTTGGLTNPVDLIASTDGAAYRDTILKLLEAGDVDAVMAIYTTIDSARTDEMLTGIINGVTEARRRGITQKPVVVCTMAAANTAPLHAGAESLPVYEFPEQAARALAKGRSICGMEGDAAWDVRVVPRHAAARSPHSMPRHCARSRRVMAYDAGAAAAPACGRPSAGTIRPRPLCRRGGGPGARLRVSGRRQARIGESCAQDRGRRRATSPRERTCRAHGVRGALRDRVQFARRIARGHSHPADGDKRNRNADRPLTGSDVRAARRIRTGRHSGRALPRCGISYRAAHRA